MESDPVLDMAADHYIESGLTPRAFRKLKGQFQLKEATREDLILRLFRWRIRKMETRRQQLLKQAGLRAGDGPIKIEEIIDARILPMAETAIHSVLTGGSFHQGLARLFSETPNLKRRMTTEVMADAANAFIHALEAAIPRLCREEIEERFWMSHNSLLGTMGMLDKLYDPEHPTKSEEAMWQQVYLLRDAMAALFRSPARAHFRQAMLHVVDNGQQLQLPLERVLAIKADRDYSDLFLTDRRRYYLRRSMRQWNELLPDPPFAQVHRSWIVNLTHVSHPVSNNQIQIGLDKPVPVSRGRLSALQNKWTRMHSPPL